MTITSLQGLFVDLNDAAYLVGVLDEFTEMMRERFDSTGKPIRQTPGPRLAEFHARLRKSTREAFRGVTTVSPTERFKQDRDDAGQPISRECGTEIAASILGISPAGVRYLAREGRLPARWTGTRWKFDARSVEQRAEWQAERRGDR